MKVLVTGAAGFIGSHVALRLLERGDTVVGVDNLSTYYDPALKQARLDRLRGDGYCDVRADIADRDAMRELFAEHQPLRVVHLAAQPGVRHSLMHPHGCVEANIVGFVNVLEGCRHTGVEHLVYASSSSVYGANVVLPYSVQQNVDHPLSLYGATKKANELMAHTYSAAFGLPTTGLRFFTVYGPWGRPDMALFSFTQRILAGTPIDVYNHGRHTRGFTYIDDIVEGVVRVLDKLPQANPDWASSGNDPATSLAPYRIYNIGADKAINLMRYIEVLEATLERKANLNMLPQQPGEMADTLADVEDLMQAVGYQPRTPIEVGVRNFVEWYRGYYKT